MVYHSIGPLEIARLYVPIIYVHSSTVLMHAV